MAYTICASFGVFFCLVVFAGVCYARSQKSRRGPEGEYAWAQDGKKQNGIIDFAVGGECSTTWNKTTWSLSGTDVCVADVRGEGQYLLHFDSEFKEFTCGPDKDTSTSTRHVDEPNHVQARSADILAQPPAPEWKLCVVEYAADAGADGAPGQRRADSIPIVNGVIRAGAACELVSYKHGEHDEFRRAIEQYHALIVRVDRAHLARTAPRGAGPRFDELMSEMAGRGKVVLSSPEVETKMGASDALLKIRDLPIGVPDTLAYYTKEEMESGFKRTVAFQPRVIKQNRGAPGEGAWLCWLQKRAYCAEYGDEEASDEDMVKLMDMSDNHVEVHTIREFIEFCVNGPGGAAGQWASASSGQYIDGGRAAGAHLTDQRLLPRVSEEEVRVLMVMDTIHQIVHKKPGEDPSGVDDGHLHTVYPPDAPTYAPLVSQLNRALPILRTCLGIEHQPFPLLWAIDFMPMDGNTPGSTDWVVGEFNCSCVAVDKFQVCGVDETLADVSDEDYREASKLTDLMGKKAVELLEHLRNTPVGWKLPEVPWTEKEIFRGGGDKSRATEVPARAQSPDAETQHLFSAGRASEREVQAAAELRQRPGSPTHMHTGVGTASPVTPVPPVPLGGVVGYGTMAAPCDDGRSCGVQFPTPRAPPPPSAGAAAAPPPPPGGLPLWEQYYTAAALPPPHRGAAPNPKPAFPRTLTPRGPALPAPGPPQR